MRALNEAPRYLVAIRPVSSRSISAAQAGWPHSQRMLFVSRPAGEAQ
jgi:hypothetical protein